MPHIRKQIDFEGKDLWYLVGLIATDGCLSGSGRNITLVAKEYSFLELIKKTYGLNHKIGITHSGKSGKWTQHRIQISNKNFYEFLLEVGLTPKKSLTLNGLEVPEECFHDFIRGVIDGDGSIKRWTNCSNGHEQWSLCIYSASSAFIRWLERVVEYRCGAAGRIQCDKKNIFVLKYGKLAAQRILSICYYEGCVSLVRKADLARLCGITTTGWARSKTLLDVA